MDTHGDVGCVPILLHSYFWIWFPTLILYVKKQHKKRHHQSTLLVTKEAGPKATGFERNACTVPRAGAERLTSLAASQSSSAFRSDSRDFSMSTMR